MTTTINNEHEKLNFSSEREQSQVYLNSAEHEKNQGQKVLNVPNKREQNQTCLDSAEREGLRQKGNVPNLRFKEFQGEWEKCKLGDLCNVLMCKRILASQTNTEEGVPFYKIGTIGNAPDAYISKELFDDYKTKYNYPHKGEVMITCAGTVGKCVIYDGKDAYYQDSNIVWIDNLSQCISNSFLYHLLAKVDWRKLNSTTIIRIYNDDLRNLKLSYPQIEEQQKISRLLSLLDERIATQNKIIEDLKKLKSAISKHLFTRKDLLETTICLADIATLKNGYAFQSSKYNTQGKWKVLTIANVSGERYISDDDCNCIITLPNDIQDHQVLKEGDILISLTGNVGRVSLCKAGNYLLNQRVGLLLLAKNVDKEFIYQVLSSQRFENSMIACGQGAAQMNIGKGDVESYILPYSSNANNIRMIAEILQSYDEFIINELRVQTLLTMQKQYFLHQMFI